MDSINHKVLNAYQNPPALDQMFTGHTGFEISMIKEACHQMGWSLEFRNPPDLSWGKLGDDKIWSGHVGYLMENKADLAIGTVGLFVERNNVSKNTGIYICNRNSTSQTLKT